MNDLRPNQRPLPDTLYFRPEVDLVTASVDNSHLTAVSPAQCARHGGTVRVGKYRLVEELVVTAEYAVTVSEVHP